MNRKDERPDITGQYGNNPHRDPEAGAKITRPQEEWVTAFDPMTDTQASQLKILSEEMDEPAAYEDGLTKAEASKRIEALEAKRNADKPSRP